MNKQKLICHICIYGGWKFYWHDLKQEKSDHFMSNTLCFILCLGEYSCLQVDLMFARQLSFFVVTIYVPCSMTVTVSWFSFWLDHKAVSLCNLVSDWSLIWALVSPSTCPAPWLLLSPGSPSGWITKRWVYVTSFLIGPWYGHWCHHLRALLRDCYCLLVLLLVGFQSSELM
jgi:hypothetical protein